MKNNFFSPRMLFVTTAILLAVFSRFLHIPNFNAVGAVALFAGACMANRWLSLLVPMAAMAISDLYFGSHETLWAVYLSFGIITMLGWAIRERQGAFSIVGMSLVSAVLFFFVTNAAMWVVGFWVESPLYSTSFSGLVLSIEAGIPFFAGTLISQLAFGAILFGAFHAARVWKPSLVKA